MNNEDGSSGGGAGAMTALGRPDVAPVPRVALTREEAAAALGIGLDSFERYVRGLGKKEMMRLIRWGRIRLVPVSELQRFAEDAAERTLP